jgi:hypothetical protein
MPCTPVAAVVEVLLVTPQSSRADDEHRVDGRVHQALPPVSVACSMPRWNVAMGVDLPSPGPVRPS